MATDKIKFTSPFLTAQYPKISKPDTVGKYADGKFKTKLVGNIADPEVKAFVALIDDAVAKLFGKVTKTTHVPYSIDEETGEVTFGTFKSKYGPAVFDARGNQLPAVRNKDGDITGCKVQIGSGSTIRVMGNMTAFDKGVSIGINQVQVKDLRNGTSSAFGAVDDGYEYDESEYNDEDDSGFETADSGSNSALDI